MTMLERMARAMATADRYDPDARLLGFEIRRWERYVPKALAALEAIRKPNEEMIDGARTVPFDPDTWSADIADSYTAMIDAIRECKA